MAPRWLIGIATVVLTLAAAALTLLLGAILAFGCDGTDASDPPEPGSFEGRLCDGEIGLPVLLVPALALVAGGAISLRARRWPPLAIGAAVAAIVLALVFRAIR